MHCKLCYLSGILLSIEFLLFSNVTNVVQIRALNVKNNDFKFKKFTFIPSKKISNQFFDHKIQPLIFHFKDGLFIFSEVNGKLEAKIHWYNNQDKEGEQEIRHSFIG